MNREDISRMAWEAGIRVAPVSSDVDHRNVYLHELERFAALVADAEREACAKVCEDISPKFEDVPYGDIRWGWKHKCRYAAAIRARSKT